MTHIQKYRILIIDDHAFPIGGYLPILLSKLYRYLYERDFDSNIIEKINCIYSAVENIDNGNIVVLDEKHRVLEFQIGTIIKVTVYNYDAQKSPEHNQQNIVKLIQDNSINIFWTDRGHSLAIKKGEKLFGCKDKKYFSSKADLFFERSSDDSPHQIVSSLIKNEVKQIAVFSFAPLITQAEIEEKRRVYRDNFHKAGYEIPDENVYLLETSPILNLFNEDNVLSSGNDKDGLYGTVGAYKKYGQLLGSVLFDLFLQLNEFKTRLSDNQKRYNFFNRYNRSFLRYFKLINSKLVKKTGGFKIGFVSFYGKIYGREHFLIDVPYKEYYEKYDNELKKGIESIIEPIKTDKLEDSKKWLHFKYKEDTDGKFIGCYELEESINARGDLVKSFLPLLHTGIFYEPDFYINEDFPFDKFNIITKDDFCLDTENSCVEIIYLFKKVSFEGIQGVSHLVVWRRVQSKSENIELTKTIEEIWENYYRLVEPKLEAALVNILQSETAKQAIKSAISQVMARNSSHNIGSHVMNKLINGKILKQLNLVELYSKKNKDQKFNYHSLIEIESLGEEAESYHQLAIFNNYVKCRMDYLSDITFGTPLMQTTKKVYDLFEELDKVRLLLENISGLTEFHYKIKFTFNGGDIDKNLSLALPNDILGCQALYNIIENVIRNTAKHSKNKEKAVDDNGKKMIIFTINIKEIEKDIPAEVQCAECYEVEIFDNVPVESGDKEFKTDDEIIELKNYVEDYSRDNDKKFSEKTPVSNIDYLVYSQNKKLNESILQDNNSLRASGLGLIEIEASASYLRKLDISNIESDAYNIDYNDAIFNKASNNLNIVKAFSKETEVNEVKVHSLGYRFFMLRPAEVLVVTDSELKNVNTNDWLKLGVKIIGINDFRTSLEGGKVVYNHQFLVYDDDRVKEIIELIEKKVIGGKEYDLFKYKTSLPLRYFKYNLKELFNVETFPEMEKILWTHRIKEVAEKTTYKVKNATIDTIEYTSIVLLDHVDEDNENTVNSKSAKDKIIENKGQYYIEALSSKAQTKLPDFYKLGIGKLDKPLKNYLKEIDDSRVEYSAQENKIIESALSKILVIDERIQAACKEKFIGITFDYLYDAAKIIVPPLINVPDKNKESIIDLADSNFDEQLKLKIKTYIETQISTGCNFALIHYSILERIFEKVGDDKEKAINDYLDILSTQKIDIVVTSGRGIPQGLTKSVRYVNLSPVIMSLVDIRSKFLIHNILHSTR
jgi:hypothetical protein